ncbi:outer membrane beta-barrel protein [Helicobacter sp. 13S00477-4]|uniref:outer membrane beta-barrel protein n=1 Tax=Helicobacter sp. 13S00477-4 TaxID=1905759 RepID=UPI000BA5DCD2|nr:outer membrane beta-barrel protein [Helicobacter sp. 13S00477-4]PAF52264.1 hypothetical protein BKH44_02850 [Helicobacter sp. 13S00477-4]
MNPLHKSIFAFLFIIASFISFAQARFFIGIDNGHTIDRVDVNTEASYDSTGSMITPASYIKNAYKGTGWLININLGTQHYFDKNQFIGFRWFFTGGYGRTDLVNQVINKIHYPSSIINIALGADILLDVIEFGGNNSLGLFGGVEGGVSSVFSDKTFYYDEENLHSFVAPEVFSSVRTGISLFLAQHHRIEFVAKIPVYDLSFAKNPDSYDSNIYKPIQLMLGYKFVF